MRERMPIVGSFESRFPRICAESRERVIDASIILIHFTCTKHDESEPMLLAQHFVNPKVVPMPRRGDLPRQQSDLEPWQKAKEVLEQNRRNSGYLYDLIVGRLELMRKELQLFGQIG